MLFFYIKSIVLKTMMCSISHFRLWCHTGVMFRTYSVDDSTAHHLWHQNNKEDAIIT